MKLLCPERGVGNPSKKKIKLNAKGRETSPIGGRKRGFRNDWGKISRLEKRVPMIPREVDTKEGDKKTNQTAQERLKKLTI